MRVVIYTICLLGLMAMAACALPPTMIGKTEFNRKDRYHWEEMAELGDTQSQYLLGHSYCCGYSTTNDNVKALKYLCMAARNGHTQAMVEIADFWRSDKEFQLPFDKKQDFIRPRNDKLSYAWFSLAAAKRHYNASEMQYHVADKLTDKELLEAKAMVSEYPNIPCELDGE